MTPELHLLTHNIVGIVSTITMVGIGFFTLLNNPKQIANITMALTVWAAAIFALSHVIGVNIVDPHISKIVLMFNLSVFFIAAFQIHAILALTGKNKDRKNFIRLIYGSAIFLTLLFIAHPDWFLMDSVSKMYFINYYAPGILNWTRVAFLYGIIIPFAVYELAKAYKRSSVQLEKNQYKYFIGAIISAYGIGFLPNFLVYDIQIDPLWGMAFGFIFAIPFAYGAIKYELFSIRVIAKQALLYSTAIAFVGAIIVVLNYINTILKDIYPGFPTWGIALFSSMLIVTISVIVWRHLRESDILKYEFITTVTHKFRTPLTHIKWASENISQATTSEDIHTQVGYIQNANTKLVELTNLLVNVSETENSTYDYHIQKSDISQIAEEIIISLENQLKAQEIKVIKKIQPNMNADADPVRIKFIIQTFIENAIHYTPKGSTITVSVFKHDFDVICSVKDSGIGLTSEEIPRLFSKFYRGKQARMTDTEGMGIGLFISKQIIEKHKGKIWAESEGRDKGSMFIFSLPAS